MASDLSEQMKMNADELYREELFSDRQVGTIRKLIPVTADGDEDTSRKVLYIGSSQVMTPAGALPISFELEADSLSEAVAGFGPAAEQALEETIKELQEMQREAASSIVVPKAGETGGMGGSGGGFGGLQMP